MRNHMHRKDILIAIQIPYSIEYLTWTILLFLCARKNGIAKLNMPTYAQIIYKNLA